MMTSTQERLRSTVAEFFGTAVESVGPEFPIAGPRVAGSVGRGLLDAAIRRRVGVKCAGVYTARTYGELEADATGNPAPAVAPSAPSTISHGRHDLGASNGVACGVDIEMIANLPEATDYWEHDFYKTHFTRGEIGYCLLQENPRMHFAARWCAKEALKKCDPRFLSEDMSRIGVALDPAGAPSLRYENGDTPKPLPHALSISHTPTIAVGVVVFHANGPTSHESNAPRVTPPTMSSESASAGSVAKRGIGGLLSLALAVLALILALIALAKAGH